MFLKSFQSFYRSRLGYCPPVPPCIRPWLISLLNKILWRIWMSSSGRVPRGRFLISCLIDIRYFTFIVFKHNKVNHLVTSFLSGRSTLKRLVNLIFISNQLFSNYRFRSKQREAANWQHLFISCLCINAACMKAG